MQSDAYAATLKTMVVAEITKNLTMAGDPACLFVDVGTPEGKATGLVRDSVVSAYTVTRTRQDTVETKLGALPPPLLQKLDTCLKAALGLP